MSQPPRVDLFDPAFKADPYPTYARLRSSAPVHRAALPDGRGVWLITRYEDVLAVLKDPRFVKDWRGALTPEQLAEIPPIPEVMKPLSRNMLDTDPPDHERLRALVSRAFTPRLVERMRPRVQAIADGLLDAVEDRGEMDLIDDYAFPLPITVIAELLGMVFLLLVAGHETTVNLIGNGVLALLQHPGQLRKLEEDPSLIKPAVEELLRFDGPVETSTERFAGEDVTIGETVIPRGEMVLVVLAAADHDPERFSDPDELDITRADNRHLAFGKGIHHCLGAPLARMEGQIAISTLLRRIPNLRLKGSPESLSWRPGMILRGLRGLPVEF